MSDTDKLERERLKGVHAKVAYDNFISEFITQKRDLLHETFKQVSIEDIAAMQEIKRTYGLLDALEIEIQSIIDTGKMASSTLNKGQ